MNRVVARDYCTSNVGVQRYVSVKYQFASVLVPKLVCDLCRLKNVWINIWTLTTLFLWKTRLWKCPIPFFRRFYNPCFSSRPHQHPIQSQLSPLIISLQCWASLTLLPAFFFISLPELLAPPSTTVYRPFKKDILHLLNELF